MTTSPKVITIDGPSGSGKGTIALLLAQQLGWHFLDSGALYRVLALAALLRNIPIEDEKLITQLAENLHVEFKKKEASSQVFLETEILLDGQSVTAEIRSESAGAIASKIAAYPGVRQALLARQRAFLKPPGLVADGRDMGTTVFPHAALKIYLEATLEARAKRRLLQLTPEGKGMPKELNTPGNEELNISSNNVNLQAILLKMQERDVRDKKRAASPLKPAEDAVVIDTTDLGIEEVFQAVMAIVKTASIIGQ